MKFGAIILSSVLAAVMIASGSAAQQSPRNAAFSAATVEAPREGAAGQNRIDPAWPKRIVIIADSVMLSAKPAVIRSLPDWQVKFEGRPALMISKAVEEMRRRSVQFPPIVVVALGYNSLW